MSALGMFAGLAARPQVSDIWIHETDSVREKKAPRVARVRLAPIPNPWGLTSRECNALAALVTFDTNKEAGKSVGLTEKSFEALVRRARQKIGVGSRIKAVVEWDRFIQKQGAQL